MEKIPDQLGFLVLSAEGGIISSGGELENEERIAEIIYEMVHSTDKSDIVPSDCKDSFNRMSIHFGSYYYAVTMSSQKVFISKRKYIPLEAVVV